jgi:hypothetical protein
LDKRRIHSGVTISSLAATSIVTVPAASLSGSGCAETGSLALRAMIPSDAYSSLLKVAWARAEIEGQQGLEFSRELLHAPVFHEAGDLQGLHAAIARDEQAAFQQRRADVLCHGFSMLKAASASRPRIRKLATPRSTPSTKKPWRITRGIVLDCVVSDPATETIAAAFSVEPEIAIGGRLDGPELPDQAAFDKDVVHRWPPQLRRRTRLSTICK